MPKVSEVRRMIFFGLMACLHTGTTPEQMDGCKIYAYAQFLRPAEGGCLFHPTFGKVLSNGLSQIKSLGLGMLKIYFNQDHNDVRTSVMRCSTRLYGEGGKGAMSARSAIHLAPQIYFPFWLILILTFNHINIYHHPRPPIGKFY